MIVLLAACYADVKVVGAEAHCPEAGHLQREKQSQSMSNHSDGVMCS